MRISDRLVLLGVTPDRLELDHGWLEPGEQLGFSFNDRIQAVRAFLEKPTAAQADAVLGAGALWNTMVMVAKVETLWELGWQCFPDIMPHFDQLRVATRRFHPGFGHRARRPRRYPQDSRVRPDQ